MSPKLRIFLLAALPMLVLDQVTKILVRANMTLGEKVSLIPNFLGLWHRDNPGAAFGFLRDFEYRIAVFTVITAIACVAIVLFLRTVPPKERWLPTALGLILSGALGNLIDRLWRQKVTDFVDVYVGWEGGLKAFLLEHVGTYRYNTFNVADIAIVIGVAMFIIHAIFLEKRREQPAK
jgi:signal peptidase II